MALVEETLFGREDKVEKAIKRLKAFEPQEGYYVAFSGGKDSQCIYHLCKLAGVKFDAHYSVTGIDPPELVRFLKANYPDVKFEYNYWNDDKPEHHYPDGRPKVITMWSLIADHTIPPTRMARYCCAALKETGGGGRIVVTGVRWAESVRRKQNHAVVDIRTSSKKLQDEAKFNPAYRETKHGDSIGFMDDNDGTRKMVEQCYMKKRTTINPIVDWEEEDVWEFLNEVVKVPHCELYDQGYTRLGCIGCPLQGRSGMERDFERYPKYKELYIKAFDRMIKNHLGEIKVASGELAENNVGGYSDIHRMAPVERLTDIPTTGAEKQAIQAHQSPPENGTGRTAERKSSNGISTSSDIHTHTHTHTRRKPIVERNGREMFKRWLWMCRPSNSAEPNPFEQRTSMGFPYNGGWN